MKQAALIKRPYLAHSYEYRGALSILDELGYQYELFVAKSNPHVMLRWWKGEGGTRYKTTARDTTMFTALNRLGRQVQAWVDANELDNLS